MEINNGEVVSGWQRDNLRRVNTRVSIPPLEVVKDPNDINNNMPALEVVKSEPEGIKNVEDIPQETTEQRNIRNMRSQEISQLQNKMRTPQSSTIKRLRKDLMSLLKHPLADASAYPSSDMLLWHVNFMVPVTIDGEIKRAPLHAVMTFPPEYPAKAPNLGFCTDFYYDMGTQYIEKKGPLKGMKVICVDILGNFHSYHTKEWVQKQGTGWTAAYTVETVLVNLQSLLIQVDSKMKTDTDRKKFYNDCLKYTVEVDGDVHTGSNPWPPVRSHEDIARENCIVKSQQDVSLIADVIDKVESFTIKAGLTSLQKDEFIRMLINAKKNCSNA